MCVLLTAWIGALLIVRLSIPFTPIRAALLVVVVGGTALGATVLHGLFGIQPFTFGMTVLFTILAIGVTALFHVLFNVFGAWHAKRLAAMA